MSTAAIAAVPSARAEQLPKSQRPSLRSSFDKSLAELVGSFRRKNGEERGTREKLEQFNALAEFKHEVQQNSPASETKNLKINRGRAYVRPGETRKMSIDDMCFPAKSPKVAPEEAGGPPNRKAGPVSNPAVRAKWRDAVAKTMVINKMMAVEQSADDVRTHYWNSELSDAKVPCGMMHPSNSYLSLWRFYMIICLAWVALLLPVDLCFDLSSAPAYFTVETIVDISFWIDLFANFFTGYRVFDRNKEAYRLEFGRWKVAKSYFKSWLFIDLVACLSSLDTLAMNSGEAIKLARMPRLLRLLRMVRLLRLLKVAKIKAEMRDLRRVSFLGDIESIFASGIAQVLKVFIFMIVMAHWIGSVWYLIAAFNWRFDEYRPQDCVNQGASWVRDSNLCDVKSDATLYLFSVYWAFSTLTTVGYGDIAARSNLEVGFSLFMMMFGVAFYSTIAGSVVNVLNNFNASIKEMNLKRESVAKFCKDNELPKELTRKLSDHLEFSFHKANSQGNKTFELDALLDDLGPQLRTETMLHLFKDLISSMPFFHDKSDEFIVRCVTDLKPRIAYPQDIIFKVGDRAGGMYFVSKGKAFVLSNLDNRTEHILATLGPGQYFGEIGCLLNRNRQNTIIAATLVELYSLDRKKVLAMMAEFPEWADEVRLKAIDRVAEGRKDAEIVDGVPSTSSGKTKDEPKLAQHSNSFESNADLQLDGSTASTMTTVANSLRATVQELLASNKIQQDRFQKQLERVEQMQLSMAKQVSALQLSGGLAPALTEREAELLWSKDGSVRASQSHRSSAEWGPDKSNNSRFVEQ